MLLDVDIHDTLLAGYILNSGENSTLFHSMMTVQYLTPTLTVVDEVGMIFWTEMWCLEINTV